MPDHDGPDGSRPAAAQGPPGGGKPGAAGTVPAAPGTRSVRTGGRNAAALISRARQIARAFARLGYRAAPGDRGGAELHPDDAARLLAALTAAGPGAGLTRASAAGPEGLARDLGTLAGELMRDCGRLTAGGRGYMVVIPEDGEPSDPVYLRRDDGQVLAVHLGALVREAEPGEAGLEAGQ